MTDDAYPVHSPRPVEDRREVGRLINKRNPGLRRALSQLERMMGYGNKARASIPFTRAEHQGRSIEEINTAVKILSLNSKGTRILHKIIAYGIEEYLADDRIVCAHCEEPVDGYQVSAGPDKGEMTYWHRSTGSLMCLDGEAEVELLQGGARQPSGPSGRLGEPGGAWRVLRLTIRKARRCLHLSLVCPRSRRRFWPGG